MMKSIIILIFIITSVQISYSFDFVAGLTSQAVVHSTNAIPFKINDVLTDSRNGWMYKVTSIGNPGNYAPAVFCGMQIQGVPAAGFTTATLQYTFATTATCSTTQDQNRYYVNIYISKLPPCAIEADDSVFYGTDGMTCYQTSVDYLLCQLSEKELPDASECCSNNKSDGNEWSIDIGGACTNLPGSCPPGQTLYSDAVFDMAYCRGVVDLPQNECGDGIIHVGAKIRYQWDEASNQCFVTTSPVYGAPEDATTDLDGINNLTKIASDAITSANVNADKIVASINANTDVTNKNNKSILDAITSGTSAIKTAIEGLEIPAPQVSVTVEGGSSSVSVDLGPVVTAVNSVDQKAQELINLIKDNPALNVDVQTPVSSLYDEFKGHLDTSFLAVENDLTNYANEAKDMDFPVTENISSKVDSIFPSTGAGGDFTVSFGTHAVSIPASTFQKVRSVLSWVFACLTLFLIFETLTTPIRGASS